MILSVSSNTKTSGYADYVLKGKSEIVSINSLNYKDLKDFIKDIKQISKASTKNESGGGGVSLLEDSSLDSFEGSYASNLKKMRSYALNNYDVDIQDYIEKIIHFSHNNINYKFNTQTNKLSKFKRDTSKVIVIDNNFKIAETLKKSIHRKKKSFNFVLSFTKEDKLTNEQMIKVYNKVLDELLIGINREDVLISSALHLDTDNHHIHFEIVDTHLTSGKELDLYSHNRDKKRLLYMRDLIEKEFGLENTFFREFDNKLTSKPKSMPWLDWRAENGQEEWEPDFIDLTKKQQTKSIKDYINSQIKYYLAEEETTSGDSGDGGDDSKTTFKIKTLTELRNKVLGIASELDGNLMLEIEEIKNINYGTLNDDGKGYKYDPYITLTTNIKDIDKHNMGHKISGEWFNEKFFELSREERLEKLKEVDCIDYDAIQREYNKQKAFFKEKQFKRLKTHSEPEAIFEFETNEDKWKDKYGKVIISKDKLFQDESGDGGNNKLDDTQKEIKIEDVLKKYDITLDDLKDPETIEKKTKGKIKFLYIQKEVSEVDLDDNNTNVKETKSNAEIKFQVNESNFEVRVKENHILNKEYEKLMIDDKNHKISEIQNAKTIDEALAIVSKIKNSNDSSVKTDFNGFKDLEDTFKHKVKDIESSELKAEFTKIVDTDKFKKEHEQEKSSIIKPDLSSFKDGFDKLIEVDKKEAKKVLNTKIHTFLDALKDEKGNKLYQVEENKNKYSIKDKSGKEWHIIDHNGEQLLFNQKEKQVQTLFQFIKQDLKLSYIQTHSFLQEKAQIKYIIRCNQDRAAFQQQILRMIQQKQILDLKGFNKELSQYDRHARIRFEAQKDAELRNVDLNTPYIISINNIMHPIEEMIPNPTIDKMKEEMAKNRDIKAKEQKTLDELFDEDPYLNQTFEIDLDDDPRSIRSHKFK